MIIDDTKCVYVTYWHCTSRADSARPPKDGFVMLRSVQSVCCNHLSRLHDTIFLFFIVFLSLSLSICLPLSFIFVFFFVVDEIILCKFQQQYIYSSFSRFLSSLFRIAIWNELSMLKFIIRYSIFSSLKHKLAHALAESLWDHG